MYRVYHGTFGIKGARSNEDSSLPMDTTATERSKALLMNMEAEVKAKASCPLSSQKRTHNVRTESIKGESNQISKLTREQIDRLVDEQRQLLIDTYKEMEKDPVKNGLKVLVMLFSEYPSYKQIWPQFRAIPDSSLMNAMELRQEDLLMRSN
ncbi:unnamed protein product [Cylicocyclus nassatus]|uniref:Uncharacterized protein n=1 Tax=Cylicocyclus nassatus TaxID=53992 RepID=A0AA36H1R7_CYLNA|nr:unnamed protein product [Cylicocyclus nassatus]